MSINPDWVKWCTQSLNIHFKDLLEGCGYIHFEGRRRPSEEKVPRLEIRYDGPDFEEISNKCWEARVQVNILIVAKRDDRQVYSLETIKGKVALALDKCVHVYRYGETDNPLLDCLHSKGKIIISNFTSKDEDQPDQLLLSTLEREFLITLKGE